MYNVTAVVPAGQGMGIHLAGVRLREAHTLEEAHHIIADEVADTTNGVILVDETYLVDVPAKLRKLMDERAVPLVVGMPVITRWEAAHAREHVIEALIHKAVGYRIKVDDGD